MPKLTVIQSPQPRQLEFNGGEYLLHLLNAAGISVSSACAGHGFCGLCRIKIAHGEVSRLSEVEKKCLSAQQIQQGIRLACQVQALGDLSLTVENTVNMLKWKKLQPLDKSLCNQQDRYGLAFDLGTTRLRLSLWNLTQRRRVIAWLMFNPQFQFGADVLTRLMLATQDAMNAAAQQQLIIEALQNALAIIRKLPVTVAQIDKLFIVGNSAMLALFSQKNFSQLLETDYWTQAVDCKFENAAALQRALGLSPQSVIANVPPLGGFIGSDLLAGIIATKLMNSTDCKLLIDFGTNSEFALWDGATLWVSSVPGGPAFEGSGISCGLPAGAGAIYRMQQNCDGNWEYQCFANSPPNGLCGSALVDVVAQLLLKGQLTRNGRFKHATQTEIVLPLISAPSLSLKKQDIDVFQRAKAATGAAQQQLLKQAGITAAQLTQVYVCGAFGRFLDISHAQAVGLLPTVAVEKVQLIENSALNGCELLLSAANYPAVLTQITANMRLVNMAHALNFDDCFVDNLYLQPLRIEN